MCQARHVPSGPFFNRRMHAVRMQYKQPTWIVQAGPHTLGFAVPVDVDGPMDADGPMDWPSIAFRTWTMVLQSG